VSEARSCPKCNGKLISGKRFRAIADVELVENIVVLDGPVRVFYFEDCGYLGSYREKRGQ
jgi:hypothetical protein